MEKYDLIKINMKEEIEQLLEHRIQNMIKNYENIKVTVCAELNEKLIRIIKEREGCVVISFLRSSYITKSNKFKVSFYEQELFVEEKPASFLYSMDTFLAGIEEDINRLWTITEKKFVQVYLWRKEELRRFYMEKIYKASVIIFRNIINDMDRTGEGIEVFYGEEIGYVEQIGIIGSERIR